MKSTLLFAAFAAALAFVSCESDDLVESQESGLVFTAVIDNEADTRTTINAQTGQISWVTGDVITINGVQYTATVDASNASKATFTKKNSSDADPTKNSEGKYVATYGSGLEIYQTYSANVPALPMSATSNDLNLTFTVTCGLLEVNLTQTSSPASGKTAISSVKTIKVTYTDDTSDYKLTCTNAVSLNTSSATSFYIALPAGTINTFIITDNSDNTCTISKSVTIQANHITPIKFSSKLVY